MLANLLIGLREGLEAALIVGILIAYLRKSGREHGTGQIFLGVGLAIFVAIALGLALTSFVNNAEGGLNQSIGAGTSLLAVGFVTWMVFWMKRESASIGSNLRSRIDDSKTGALTVAIIAFVSVIREGVETSIFLWSSTRATSVGDNPIFGAFIGLTIAAFLGWLIFRGAVKLNLGKFFRYTGSFLIVVSAGILSYAVSELEEVASLPLQQKAYDVSGALPNGSVAEATLHGLVSFNPAPSILQVVVWFAYLVPVLTIYLRKKA